MKKIFAFVLGISMILSLTACSSIDVPRTYTETIDGIEYSVENDENISTDDSGEYYFTGIISDGENRYNYTFSGTITRYSVDITYPDGSMYEWRSEGSGFGSDGYNPEKYVDADILCQVIENQFANIDDEPSNILVIALLLILGAISIFLPGLLWYISYGWRFKDAEPSDAALVFYRVAGGIFIIIAVIMMI